MGAMAEGWLPPTAPGAKPPPRFDAPREQYAPPQPAQQPPPSGPTFVRPGAAPPAAKGNRAALWAIWLGITGIALLVLSLGSLFPLTLPLSFAAWVLARRAQRQIESGATTQGDGQATAALWLGPFVFLILGAWILLRRISRRRIAQSPLSEAERARAAKLLE